MNTMQMQMDLGELAKGRFDRGPAEFIAARLSKALTGEDRLMEMICERENMLKALKRVESNKGSLGVDGMRTTQLRGWAGYFKLGLPVTLAKELDHWIRRRLRAYVWKQWRLSRTKVRNLKARGARHKWAMMVGNTRKGEWRLSKNGTLCAALPDSYFTRSLGLVLLGPPCR